MTIQVSVTDKPLTFVTHGLDAHGHPEIRASVTETTLVAECAAYLRFVANYLMKQGTRITSNQTLAYGYWLTKFIEAHDGVLDVWEYKADASEFVEGVSLTLTYWQDQHAICRSAGAEFAPPRPDKKVAISTGVYEGDPVEGVRYPSPEHMSGWWLTTDKFDGDVKSLKVVPLFNVTAARPDLARYIALPCGYRFTMQPLDIWLDEEVAKSNP